MNKHFINLTNGLEWIPDLPEYSFVRVESTAIEKQDWDRVLRDLDSNLLMNLALGHTCNFYDCGSRRTFSKTVTLGIPYIRNYLTAAWIGSQEIKAATKEKQALKRKLKYFKRFLNTPEIRLIGHSKITYNDGNKDFYRTLAYGITHDHHQHLPQDSQTDLDESRRLLLLPG